ncbi:MAG TPA: cytochrome c-type biogenesis protein [Sphingomonas sp.]|uniref:cytochrome c-type biogenesis protein n=1 Tax=Sphingomonas sp. TaxID=28214 RepID=UPI002EDAB0FB
MRGMAVPMLMLMVSPVMVSAQSNVPPAALSDTQLPDARQEAEARALMETLRCLVCQGQSIADSDADLAGDMRALVRRRIAAGEQPEAIRAWLVQRYGSWVSYDPPLDAVTWPLWALPLLLLVIGAVVARGSLKRRSRR